MITNGETDMRCRLAVGEGTNEFPILAALAAQGGTDYRARIVPFGDRGSIGETRGGPRPGRPVTPAVSPNGIST